MPTIHYTSSIKTETDHSTLSLLVHHNILTDLSPHPTHRLSICLPSNISVFLANPKALVINLTGESNHENATSSELLNSQLAQHICQHLQMSATKLGLASAVPAALDADGNPFLNILPLRHRSSRAAHPIYVNLVSLTLRFVWQFEGTGASHLSHPFATKLSLPFRIMLDEVIARFIDGQLIGRYPLIFGPWCQQLDREMTFSKSAICSLTNVMERSSSRPSSKRKYNHLIKILREEYVNDLIYASSCLESCLSATSIDRPSVAQAPSIDLAQLKVKDLLLWGLERIFWQTIKRTKIKDTILTTTPLEDILSDGNLTSARGDDVRDKSPVPDVLNEYAGAAIQQSFFAPNMGRYGSAMNIVYPLHTAGLPLKPFSLRGSDTPFKTSTTNYDKVSPDRGYEEFVVKPTVACANEAIIHLTVGDENEADCRVHESDAESDMEMQSDGHEILISSPLLSPSTPFSSSPVILPIIDDVDQEVCPADLYEADSKLRVIMDAYNVHRALDSNLWGQCGQSETWEESEDELLMSGDDGEEKIFKVLTDLWVSSAKGALDPWEGVPDGEHEASIFDGPDECVFDDQLYYGNNDRWTRDRKEDALLLDDEYDFDSDLVSLNGVDCDVELDGEFRLADKVDAMRDDDNLDSDLIDMDSGLEA